MTLINLCKNTVHCLAHSSRFQAATAVRKEASRRVAPPLMPCYQRRLPFATSHMPPSNSLQDKPVSKTKQFMKKYGYVGIGVYLTLSAVDLAATMAVINVKGADKVMEVEHYVLGKVKGWVGMEHPPLDKSRLYEHKPSLTSIFVVAYGIHKTVLLPVRLSLTAAITPTVARRLKNWGWLKSKLPK